MITIGSSGAESIQLYSPRLQSFQKDCLFLQQDNLFNISYVSQDNAVKVYRDTETLAEAIEVFWQMLTKNFAAIICEIEKKIIFLIEESGFLKKIVNCSYDLRTVFGGTPYGYNFDELLEEANDSSFSWRIISLDGIPAQESFWLKKKELLACSGNRNFWAYQFSRSKRVNRATQMTEHQPPISPIG